LGEDPGPRFKTLAGGPGKLGYGIAGQPEFVDCAGIYPHGKQTENLFEQEKQADCG
jgi:hypothetical protein